MKIVTESSPNALAIKQIMKVLKSNINENNEITISALEECLQQAYMLGRDSVKKSEDKTK